MEGCKENQDEELKKKKKVTPWEMRQKTEKLRHK